VQCNVQNCGSLYNSWGSFKNHVSWKHRRNRFQRHNIANIPAIELEQNFIIIGKIKYDYII
jgi:hypothetical protein